MTKTGAGSTVNATPSALIGDIVLNKKNLTPLFSMRC